MRQRQHSKHTETSPRTHTHTHTPVHSLTHLSGLGSVFETPGPLRTLSLDVNQTWTLISAQLLSTPCDPENYFTTLSLCFLFY